MPLHNFRVIYTDKIASNAGLFKLVLNRNFCLYTYLGGEGPFFFFIDDKLIEPKPGDVLILRPGIICGNCKKIKARYERIKVNIPEDFVDFIGVIDQKLEAFLKGSRICHVSFSGSDAAEYAALMDEMKNLIGQHNVAHKNALYASLVLKQTALLCKASSEQMPVRASSDNELIHSIVELINSEYASLSTVADVASRLNYSTNYLSQYFHKHMSIGLHDFLIQKKLAASTVMLIEGKSVTECAYECGFGSTAYFISAFKKRYGITPGQFEKNAVH